MIKVEEISKSFGTIKAVDRASFEVSKGEVVGFLGPNAAGKTTTMRLLTGYLIPDSGNCEIAGYDLLKNTDEIKEYIGYLPENAPLYDNMLVYDFLLYTANLRKISNPVKRVREIIEIAAIENVYRRDIYELSKGFRQRVCFAQSIIHDPEILILDEPTSGLDPNQIIEIRKLIRSLGQEKTIIISTHILSEVSATCDRVLIINEGRIVADESTKDLSDIFSGEKIINITIKGRKSEIEEKLNSIRGVRELSLVSESGSWLNYKIKSTLKTDPGEIIFKRAVENNWVIKELHQEKVSLEDIFIKLTSESKEEK